VVHLKGGENGYSSPSCIGCPQRQLERLPESFKGPYIELRLNFLYNLPLSALNP
jgi:hypothetical protein